MQPMHELDLYQKKMLGSTKQVLFEDPTETTPCSDYMNPKIELVHIGNETSVGSEKTGRIIRAKEDIAEGEILLVEQGYASVLHQSDIHYNSHRFCVVCQKQKTTDDLQSQYMLCGSRKCKILMKEIYREDTTYNGLSLYDFMLSIAEECGVEFSLLLLVYRICMKYEFDSVNQEPKYAEVVEKDKLLTLLSLETHKDEIYPEHLFLFRKAASRLKETILSSDTISEELVVDTFCRIFVNAHSITHTRWWWRSGTEEMEPQDWLAFFQGDNNETVYSPFFIPKCNIDKDATTENSCADFREIGTGLFPMVSMFDHSCSPNCSFQTFDDMHSSNHYPGNVIFVQTVQKVKKGEELCISYIDIMNPTNIRRRELWYSKYFVCKCLRCMSSTEGNRFVRAYHCNNIDCDGIIVPIYQCNISEEPKKQLVSTNHVDSENDFNIDDFEEEDYDKALAIFEEIYESGEQLNHMHDQREVDEDYLQRISYWDCTVCGKVENETLREVLQNMERHVGQNIVSLGQRFSEDNLDMDNLSKDAYCQKVLETIEEIQSLLESLTNGSNLNGITLHKNHYHIFQLKGKYISMIIKLFENDHFHNQSYSNCSDILERGLQYLKDMQRSAQCIFPSFHNEIMLFYCKLLKYLCWMKENSIGDNISKEFIQDNLDKMLDQYRVVFK